MKKLFTNILAILIIPALYFVLVSAFTKSSITESEKTVSSTVSNDTSGFVNIIQNMDYNRCHSLWIRNLLHLYGDSLGYNAVHVYPSDNSVYGKFDSVYSGDQINNNKSLIDAVFDKNLKFFYEQVKFSYLCFAQRIVYEVPVSNGNNTANNGFCFTNIQVAPSVDSNRTVLFSPQKINHEPELLCSNIYENLQHSDFFGRQHDMVDWYLKPMVRANLSGVDRFTPIFKIEINDFDSIKFYEKIFYAFNFEKDINLYEHGYIEKYYGLDHNTISIPFTGDTLTGINKGRNRKPLDSCKVDFKIYTYGYVDFWFDKLTVDDEYANDLFNNKRDSTIQDELSHVGDNDNLYSYYMDEVTYSQLPCIKYVMDKISNYNSTHNKNIKFMVSESNWMATHVMRNHSIQHKVTLDWLKPRILNVFAYEFWGDNSGWTYIPAFALNPNNIEQKLPSAWKTNSYNAYNNYLQTEVLGSKNAAGGHESGAFVYQISLAKDNIINSTSQGTMLYVTPQMQGEMHIASDKLIGIREPLNEEIEVQTMCALAHGAQGLFGYVFQTTIDANNLYSPMSHVFGLYGHPNKINGNGDYRRIQNHYGQNKWAFIKNMNGKINNWIPTLDKINWQEGYSTHDQETSHYFINDIRSIYRDLSGYFTDGPTCTNCDNVKYWEEGFFEPKDQNDRSKYFLMVNRRCVPEINGINLGDIRQLRIQFKPSELTGFNNWKLIDIKNDSVMLTFNKNSTDFMNAGVFQPGEGKLFKLAPVMQEGGTFVCDEVVTATTFNCNGIVNTGGYNLNIPATNGLTTISFAQNGTILGYDGTDFLIGGNNQVVLQGQNGGKWRGITVNNYSNAEIFNTKFQDIGDVQSSSLWAMSFYNCLWSSVRSSQFILPPQAKGINVNNFAVSEYTNVAIMNNNISTDNSTAAVFVGCSSLGYCNLFVMDNYITSGSTQSTFGILLSNVYSSYADRNTISGFEFGIKLMTSTLELSDNIISSTGGNNTSILATSSSTINMGLIGNDFFGGNNKFSNYGANSRNVSLNNSIFEMNYGSNNLFVSDNFGNFNLVGNGNFIPADDGPLPFVYAIGNCFNGEGGFAKDSITDWNGLRDSLIELPHYCNIQQDRIADFTVPVINNIVDTVYKSTLPQFQSISPSVTLYRDFYKSVMKRNYDSTKILGTQLLTIYSDSITTADVISLMYFANTKLADISANMQSLKTFLEQLIINHPQNLTLVRTANYFVQKCKVHLQQYTSALDGYQDIIAQNPYSYEGLVASWDYASTLLLANSGGAYSNNEDESLNSLVLESQFLVDSLRMKRLMNTDKYDRKVFTQEDRKVLIKSVGDVLKEDRQKQIEKVKSLEEELHKSKGNNTSKAKQKLEEVKNLNLLIKTKRPKDTEEYKLIINNDIEKLYPKKSGSDSNPQSTVPTTYALYQNYPNPFNPTTKIAYDIPRDAKVKLVIYDILGREMKTLVNNEFKTAGKYIIEFNGSTLASGIYFARILVNEGKDFMAVKKMVMVK